MPKYLFVLTDGQHIAAWGAMTEEKAETQGTESENWRWQKVSELEVIETKDLIQELANRVEV